MTEQDKRLIIVKKVFSCFQEAVFRPRGIPGGIQKDITYGNTLKKYHPQGDDYKFIFTLWNLPRPDRKNLKPVLGFHDPLTDQEYEIVGTTWTKVNIQTMFDQLDAWLDVNLKQIK